MIRNLILFAIVFVVTAFLGYRSGQSKAKEILAKKITMSSKVNGNWTYINTSQPNEESSISLFLMATGEVLGGNHEQSLFLIADRDVDGEVINSNNQYIIEGGKIAAECWNLSVYDPDYLIENNEGHYFVSNSMVEGDNWSVFLTSGNSRSNNSLSIGKNTTSAAVVLRIYNPKPELIEALEFIELPTIKKIKS